MRIEEILFIDIETATAVPNYSDLKPGIQEQWIRKTKSFALKNGEEKTPADFFQEKAAIFAEFGRVVCVGLGCFLKENGQWKFKMKSITADDEKTLLLNFSKALERFTSLHKKAKFCGHNIKEFDIPFLCRRMLVNGLELPPIMQLNGMKPWEIPHIDTLELWRFGDYKHYISLALLAEIFNIPSPKDDIDGSMVSAVFWNEKNTERISQYCLKDVFTTAKVFLKLKGITEVEAEPEFV
jgi:hypothetical protein